MTLAEQVRVKRALPSPAAAAAIMADADVTMRQIALEGQVAPTTVRRYLSGRRLRPETAAKLAKVLDELAAAVS
jgi:transcriptional regulator with XRE-family HTH domain